MLRQGGAFCWVGLQKLRSKWGPLLFQGLQRVCSAVEARMVSAAGGGGDGDRMRAQQLSDRVAQAGNRRAEALSGSGLAVFTTGLRADGGGVAWLTPWLSD